MKRFLLVALFAMAVGPTPAQATTEPCQPYPYCCAFEENPWKCLAGETDAPAGSKCAFNSTTDVTREAGWQTGDVRFGPLVTGESGTLHCKFIVNSNFHGSTQVRADKTQRDTAGVVVGADTLNYQATAADDIAVCAQWDPDAAGAPTLYWVPAEEPSQIPPTIPPSTNPGDYQGHWSTNSADPCGAATSIEPNDPECSIWKALDRRLGTNIAEIWQDCEPYEEFPLPI